MILPGTLFLWLLQCTLLLLGNADDAHRIRGVAGKDYPNYETIPQTSFRCSEQLHIPGLYADPETGCQMFHHCYEHRHESFLCPPGTIFNQALLVCDYWYSAECSEATLHYGANSPHKVISSDLETKFVSKESPSVNVFDKMASLYEVKDPVPSSSKNYRSNVHTLEESNHFSDGHILHTSMLENQKYPNSYLEVANLHDRREGIFSETFNEYSSDQDENYYENDLKDFFADFESSGESEDLEEHVFTEDDLLLLNDTEEHVDFEKQYFAYNKGKHSENDTKHHNPVNNNKEKLIDTYVDLADKQATSSKEDLESKDTFVRRQSENFDNRNDRRKNKKRKPIYMIKSEEELEHSSTTKNPNDKTKVSSNDIVDDLTSTLKEPATEFNSLSTPAPSRTKRRKPIFIDLEDIPKYTVDNGQNVPDGTRTSSINYEVNLQSKIPNFSIAAEEISVKLFPSKVERKPVNGYILDPTEKYNVGSDRNVELNSLNNLGMHASNIYDTSTLSTLKNTDRFQDVSMNLGHVYPKRKKNIIHIIDSEDDHNVYIENKEPMDATIYSTELEDEITTQSLNENFEVFETFSEPNVNYQNGEEEQSYSVEVGTEQYEDLYNFISPYTHNEVSDESDDTYFTEINPEVEFDTEKYEEGSDIEDEVNYVNPKSLQDFEVNKHDEMHDSPYVTTDFSISEISTQMPHEIQYGETSQIYFIPDTDAQSTFDNLGATEDVPNLFPETLDKNHNIKESLMNNVDPSLAESINYKQLDNSKIKSDVTEHSHSEDDDLRNLIKQLPFYSFESYKEMNLSKSSEFEESKLNYESKMLNANISQNNSHAESPISRNEVEEFDPVLDTELQEYLSNETLNTENDFSFDVTKDYTEPPISLMEDSSSEYSLEGSQYHSHDPIFDVNTLDVHDSKQDEEEFLYQTVPSKLESDHNVYLSDAPNKIDTFKEIKQENVKIKGGEFDEAFDFEVPSNDFGGSQTDSLDESEHATAPDYGLFETQNIPSYLLENSFNPKPNFNIKDTAKDSSKIVKDKVLSSTKTNNLNKEFSNLEQNIPGSIKKNVKDEPKRRPRAFISPNQMNFNLETLGSQNFASLPYSLLKLKQSGMNKVLPDSIYRLHSASMSARTGNLLESPKISKLISIGKNLLRAKKAKFRILGRYVNYF